MSRGNENTPCSSGCVPLSPHVLVSIYDGRSATAASDAQCVSMRQLPLSPLLPSSHPLSWDVYPCPCAANLGANPGAASHPPQPLSQRSLSAKQASRSSSSFPPLPSRNQLVRKRKYIQTTRLEILLSREGYFKRDLYPNDRPGSIPQDSKSAEDGEIRAGGEAERGRRRVRTLGLRGGQICLEDGDSGGGRTLQRGSLRGD